MSWFFRLAVSTKSFYFLEWVWKKAFVKVPFCFFDAATLLARDTYGAESVIPIWKTVYGCVEREAKGYIEVAFE